MAFHLAYELLKRYDISRADIRIEKPSAPIGLPFETVAAEISRKWNRAYIGLGSNIGDRKAYMDTAVKELASDDNIRVMQVADFIETEPYGYKEQNKFLNSAAKIETLYSPYELLHRLQDIEQKAHRERKIHWGPRTLDMDILMYEDIIINDENLVVPHRDMANREFVLRPLCQIDPYAVNAVTGKSVKQMYDELKSNEKQNK